MNPFTSLERFEETHGEYSDLLDKYLDAMSDLDEAIDSLGGRAKYVRRCLREMLKARVLLSRHDKEVARCVGYEVCKRDARSK